jgi:hypothetical protein
LPYLTMLLKLCGDICRIKRGGRLLNRLKESATMTESITITDVEKDIQRYQARMSTARSKLADLPTGYLPYQEYKKREKQRRELQADIKHLQQLMNYANEGVALRLQEEKYCQ